MSKEKIRRCREHAHVLKGNEPCPFPKHNKHNKIEEMTEQEAEILEWVEINTTVEQWKYSENGQEELWFRPKDHYKTKKDYFRGVVFNPQTQNLDEVIGDNFREIAQLIVEDMKTGGVEINGWIFQKKVYQFCSEAICGNNPCSCSYKNKNFKNEQNATLCFHCQKHPVINRGEAYCLVCRDWLKERAEWKKRVFERDEIIKQLNRN